jgi:hypothetical protein
MIIPRNTGLRRSAPEVPKSHTRREPAYGTSPDHFRAGGLDAPVDTDHWGTPQEWDHAVNQLPFNQLSIEHIRHQVHVNRGMTE